MKTLFLLFISALTLNAQTWLACNTAGKSLPVYVASGDIGTVNIPSPIGRSVLSFFTTQTISGNFIGKTITARFSVNTGVSTIYGCGGGAQPPATVRLYFTTATGYFNFNDSDNRHPSNYWWNGPSGVTLDSADGATYVDVTATISTAGGWTDSHGGSDPAKFTTAASSVRQIGFAFGGSNFYDTGVNANTPATFHLISFTVQ